MVTQMTRNNTLRTAVRLLLLCVFLSGCTSAAAGPIQPTATATATAAVSDALRRDAEVIASDLGISVDEAVRRLSLQDSIGKLNAQLEQEEVDTFAGLWVQHEPEFLVIVAFTRDGQETIEPYVRDTPLAELIEVRTAEVSLAELQAIQREVTPMVIGLGFSFILGINVQENRVELDITDQAVWEAALQQAGLQLPEHVEVIVTYVPLGDDRPFELTPVPDIFLPQLRVRSAAFMLSLLQGRLVVEEGCLRVDAGNVGDSYLIIWQPDYFLNDNSGRIEVLDRAGRVVARVDDTISVEGGEVPLSNVNSHLREPIPSRCKGPYWLMGDIVARE